MASPAIADKAQKDAEPDDGFRPDLKAEELAIPKDAGSARNDDSEFYRPTEEAIQSLIDQGVLPPPGPHTPILSRGYLLPAIEHLRKSGNTSPGLDLLEFELDPPTPASMDRSSPNESDLRAYVNHKPYMGPLVASMGSGFLNVGKGPSEYDAVDERSNATGFDKGPYTAPTALDKNSPKEPPAEPAPRTEVIPQVPPARPAPDPWSDFTPDGDTQDPAQPTTLSERERSALRRSMGLTKPAERPILTSSGPMRQTNGALEPIPPGESGYDSMVQDLQGRWSQSPGQMIPRAGPTYYADESKRRAFPVSDEEQALDRLSSIRKPPGAPIGPRTPKEIEEWLNGLSDADYRRYFELAKGAEVPAAEAGAGAAAEEAAAGRGLSRIPITRGLKIGGTGGLTAAIATELFLQALANRERNPEAGKRLVELATPKDAPNLGHLPDPGIPTEPGPRPALAAREKAAMERSYARRDRDALIGPDGYRKEAHAATPPASVTNPQIRKLWGSLDLEERDRAVRESETRPDLRAGA